MIAGKGDSNWNILEWRMDMQPALDPAASRRRLDLGESNSEESLELQCCFGQNALFTRKDNITIAI
jgi:hypothetical protein